MMIRLNLEENYNAVWSLLESANRQTKDLQASIAQLKSENQRLHLMVDECLSALVSAKKQHDQLKQEKCEQDQVYSQQIAKLIEEKDEYKKTCVHLTKWNEEHKKTCEHLTQWNEELKKTVDVALKDRAISKRREDHHQQTILHLVSQNKKDKLTELFMASLDLLDTDRWDVLQLKYWFVNLPHHSENEMFRKDDKDDDVSFVYGEILPNALEYEPFASKWKAATRIVDLGSGHGYLLTLMAHYHDKNNPNREVILHGFEVSQTRFHTVAKLEQRIANFHISLQNNATDVVIEMRNKQHLRFTNQNGLTYKYPELPDFFIFDIVVPRGETTEKWKEFFAKTAHFVTVLAYNGNDNDLSTIFPIDRWISSPCSLPTTWKNPGNFSFFQRKQLLPPGKV